MEIVGREKEIAELEDAYREDGFRFAAIYGRRRVGKTYLVSSLFRERLCFHHVALSTSDEEDEEPRNGQKSPLEMQLQAFRASLLLWGYPQKKAFANWVEAFTALLGFLKGKQGDGKKVIFIDELPWLDTRKSRFIEAFSWFINTASSVIPNTLVIVAGSSTSWMLDEVIHSTGGLYDRVTNPIHLSPFSLRETESYFRNKGMEMSRLDVARIYMVFGGIPFYLNFLHRGESLPEFVNRMLFARDAKLAKEYGRLFRSSFDSDKLAKEVAEFIGKRNEGYTRKQIVEGLKKADGATFSRVFDALEEGNFIVRYVPYGESKKQARYKLIDPFVRFYMRFGKNKTTLDTDYFDSEKESDFVGGAFENLIAMHLDNVKRALGVSGVRGMRFSYSIEREGDKPGAQIDLIIERKDKVIDLCEAKFRQEIYRQSEADHLNLENKIRRVKEKNPRCQVSPILITCFGLSYSGYHSDFDKVITLEDLFR